MASLFARTARRLSLGHIRHVAAVPPAAASGTVAAVYRQMESEFGMLAPPVALHAAAPEVLAAVWMILRETLLAGDVADRPAKEAVAAAVSLANTCPYCVEVHGDALSGVLAAQDAARVGAGRLDELEDPWLRGLVRWARSSGERSASRRVAAPFTPARAPEFIGVAVTFHYINRMVNIFLSESPLAPVPEGGRNAARVVAVRVLGHFARAQVRPGLSLDLLPGAEASDDLPWTGGKAHIAEAFARASAAVAAAGAHAVPAGVRALVTAGLADPETEAPGLGAGPWLDRQLSRLRPHERPAGRLALLATWASYQVSDGVIDEARAGGAGDAALVRLASWASLTAALHIGRTLYRDLMTRTG